MGFKDGIGALAIMTMSLAFIIPNITSKIPGGMDDAVLVVTFMSWVMSAFLGRPVDAGISKQLHEAGENRKMIESLRIATSDIGKNIPDWDKYAK